MNSKFASMRTCSQQPRRGHDRGSQPYSCPVGAAKWLEQKAVEKKACRRYATHTQPYRLPKGRLDRGHTFHTSHFAVPTARLYGWLPLSDAYGIGLAGSALLLCQELDNL